MAKNADGERSKDIIAYVFNAIDKQEIALSEDDAYHLMQKFCEVVFDEDQNYYATTTDEDIDNINHSSENSAAKHFIFKFPKIKPNNLRRIFVLSSVDIFHKLSAEMQSDLKDQVEGGALIYVLIHPNPNSVNFGVYGDFAVGEYSERSEKIRFRKVQVGRQKKYFGELAARAKKVIVKDGRLLLE